MLASLSRCSAPAPRPLMHLSPAYLLPTSCLSIACMRSLSRARIAGVSASMSHVQMHQNRRPDIHRMRLAGRWSAHQAQGAPEGAPGTGRTRGRTRHRAPHTGRFRQGACAPQKSSLPDDSENSGDFRKTPEFSGTCRRRFPFPINSAPRRLCRIWRQNEGRAKNAGVFLSQRRFGSLRSFPEFSGVFWKSLGGTG
jgi:hypothetical protein